MLFIYELDDNINDTIDLRVIIIKLQLDLDIRALIIPSRTNLELGPQFDVMSFSNSFLCKDESRVKYIILNLILYFEPVVFF